MQIERLLTKHIAFLLQRSRSTAKLQRSRRGYIPRDPEGDYVKVAATQEGSANCWTPEHLEGEDYSERKQKAGERFVLKHVICLHYPEDLHLLYCKRLSVLKENKSQNYFSVLGYAHSTDKISQYYLKAKTSSKSHQKLIKANVYI